MDHLNCNIIIVEDSEFYRAVLRTQLKKAGFKNVTAPQDAAEAWELIVKSLVTSDPYDLILTDLNMPEIDGLDLIERIKSDPSGENQKILVITAEADKFIEQAALSLGASGYLIKPVQVEQLKNAIFTILESKTIAGDDKKSA